MHTFSWTRKATPHLLAEFAVRVLMHPPIAENQAEVILPIVFAPNLDKIPLWFVAQSVAQLAEGFALSRDADSTT
jgi:hypothetical protein